MPALFAYLLKLSCSLSVVYLFYQLVLRRLTFYNANRWYLMGYSLLCFFIPLINISGLIEQHQLNHSAVIRAIPSIESYTHNTKPLIQNNTIASFTLWDYSFLFLVIGIIVLLTRLLVQYASYRMMRKQAQLINDDGIAIYQVSKSIIPFSFGNSIFINQCQHNEAELKEIIRHEFVHVTQRHTVDIIWAEIVCILNWYNPFAWLLRHAVRQNLEFIADNNVLESGIDKRSYQYLLLKVMGLPQFSIAAPFNFSSLKKRIVMMNTLKSAKAHLVKFLFVLPLLAVLLLAFRSEQVRQKGKQYAAVVINDTVPPPPAPPVVAPAVSAAPNVASTVTVAPEPVVGIGVDGDTSLLPDDYKSFLTRNPSVKNLYWRGHTVTIELKSGGKEIYNLNDVKSIAAAERKWGKLPVAPPPPPPPPMVTPPAAPIADTTNLPNDPTNAYIQKQEFLKEQLAQWNDSAQNGRDNANAQAIKTYLEQQLIATQQEQTAMLRQYQNLQQNAQKEMEAHEQKAQAKMYENQKDLIKAQQRQVKIQKEAELRLQMEQQTHAKKPKTTHE
jgi:beta-lactamase regulating signal transducer with metallopeptidase domain